MKRFIFLIISIALLVTGAIILSVAIKRSTKGGLEEKTYDIENEFTDFDIELDTSNVEFIYTTDGKTKVVVKENEKDFHKVEVNEGTLKVTQNENKKWYEYLFDFSFDKKKVTIYLPLKEYNKLVIKSSTSDVIIPNDFTFNSAVIILSTGDIKMKASVNNKLTTTVSTGNTDLEDMSASEMELKASTGRVSLKGVKVTSLIKINTSTGNIKLENVKASDLELKASTGDVILTDTIIDNKIKIHTSTGNVRFTNSDGYELYIRTDTGSVKGTLLTSKIFYANTDTGRINVPHSTSGGICDVETDTGNIELSISE